MKGATMITTLSVTEIIEVKALVAEYHYSSSELYEVLKDKFQDSKTLSVEGIETLLETLYKASGVDYKTFYIGAASWSKRPRENHYLKSWDRVPHGQSRRI
jgi:hypothetical protein